MNKTIFKGTCTAAVTPFTKDGIDFPALERQIEFQIQNDIDALCILGTTGEAPTISDIEYDYVANSYMFGDSFLVGGVDMKITLPEGKWLDYFTGDIYDGNCEIQYTPPKGKGGALRLLRL